MRPCTPWFNLLFGCEVKGVDGCQVAILIFKFLLAHDDVLGFIIFDLGTEDEVTIAKANVHAIGDLTVTACILLETLNRVV